MASRSKPKAEAKVAGNPWSVTTSRGASDGRALCARRCSQERRQWARSAQVKTGLARSEELAMGRAWFRSVKTWRACSPTKWAIRKSSPIVLHPRNGILGPPSGTPTLCAPQTGGRRPVACRAASCAAVGCVISLVNSAKEAASLPA